MVHPDSVTCPTCKAIVGMPCSKMGFDWNETLPHETRTEVAGKIAAVRKKAEEPLIQPAASPTFMGAEEPRRTEADAAFRYVEERQKRIRTAIRRAGQRRNARSIRDNLFRKFDDFIMGSDAEIEDEDFDDMIAANARYGKQVIHHDMLLEDEEIANAEGPYANHFREVAQVEVLDIPFVSEECGAEKTVMLQAHPQLRARITHLFIDVFPADFRGALTDIKVGNLSKIASHGEIPISRYRRLTGGAAFERLIEQGYRELIEDQCKIGPFTCEVGNLLRLEVRSFDDRPARIVASMRGKIENRIYR